MNTRECLGCGMQVSAREVRCPKCDGDLYAQTDGSTLRVDIAHSRETIVEALVKLEQAIEEANQGYYQKIRLIVGSGLIRQEVWNKLRSYQRGGDIKHYDYDGYNKGAILVLVR